jgi:sugar phosphate isomerase/epimerase
MRIGSMDDSLGQPWEKLFNAAAQIGFEGVELGVGEGYAGSKLWKADGRRELRSLSEASGVAIASICLHLYWGISFANADEAVRKKASAIAQEAAAIASEVGARNLLIPVTSSEGIDAEEARGRWVLGMRSCANAAERHGVVFALENVGQPFAQTGEQLASIVDEIGSTAVKAYYDPGNAVYDNLDAIADIEALGRRISQVHMKDPGGDHLGEGRMDIPAVIKALRAADFTGWIMLETPATDDPLKASRMNLEYLRKLL